MRKTIALLLCLVLCLGMAACSAFHDHTWSFDAKNHWCDCECGKQIEPLPHNLHENVCVACGVEIWDIGDQRNVLTYDEYGFVKTSAAYDSSGNVIREELYEWEYDQNGNPTRNKVYSNGILSEESIFQSCALAGEEVCLKESVDYYEDGSRQVCLYDEYGVVESDTMYLADGSVDTQYTYENTYDDQGNLLERVCFKDGVRYWETQSIQGPDGNLYESAMISYNADGSITFDRICDYKFDDQGNLCYYSKTSGGVIVSECFYELDPVGKVYRSLEIAYREDGTKSDEYIFDAQGNQTQHIEYNADGSIKE